MSLLAKEIEYGKKPKAYHILMNFVFTLPLIAIVFITENFASRVTDTNGEMIFAATFSSILVALYFTIMTMQQQERSLRSRYGKVIEQLHEEISEIRKIQASQLSAERKTE